MTGNRSKPLIVALATGAMPLAVNATCGIDPGAIDVFITGDGHHGDGFYYVDDTYYEDDYYVDFYVDDCCYEGGYYEEDVYYYDDGFLYP